MSQQIGKVTWISGPVVKASGSRQVGMLELVEVGEEHLVGEVIGLDGETITIQVYEETSGMHPGAPVFGTGLPLSVELGPGLLHSIFDGIQRPLPVMEKRNGSFISRGMHLTPLYRKDRWKFQPQVAVGGKDPWRRDPGHRPGNTALEHRVMVPPGMSGTLTWVAEPGEYTIEEPIARLENGHGHRGADHAAALARAPAAPLSRPPRADRAR